MPEKTSYSAVQIALHWGIALLIGVNFLFGEGVEDAFDSMMDGGAVTGWLAPLHVWVGVTVLVLVTLRLGLRLVTGAPAKIESAWPLMDRAGQMAHLALYGLMLLVPVLGAISWFGQIDATAELHVLAMNAMMALIGLHAVAALLHHFVLHDGLLLRMVRRS